jgi:hypothetical protein
VPDTEPRVELRLLTHEPDDMAAWWAALLGGSPRARSARVTEITGLRLRVLIERSHIALDYHPEASGVTGIHLVFDDAPAARPTLTRLAALGAHPHRATADTDSVVLWLRDPNGTDVGLRLAGGVPGFDIRGDEVDPQAVVATINRPEPAAAPPSRDRPGH